MKLRIENTIVLSLFLFCVFITLPTEAKYCGQPLRVARDSDDMIPNYKMKASSEDASHPASSGRLKDSGWAPKHTDYDPYPYLQIDLTNLYLVCGIKVQGCSDFYGKPAWVTRYRVQVSPEENFWDSWNYLKPEFLGGKSAKEIIYSQAKERKVGQYVKIFPVSFKNGPCMKVEVYGKSYISDKASVFVLAFPGNLVYRKGKVVEVSDSSIKVEAPNIEREYNLLSDYTEVIPNFEPLKTELKVDACIAAKRRNADYALGRIHDVKDSSYVIEWLEKVASNAMEMTYVQEFKKRDLVVVYTAWCKKIEYATRVNLDQCKCELCLGTIVLVDSELVFQPKGNPIMTRISYKKKNRPPGDDYVSSQAVVPSEVTPGKTVLFYKDRYGCLFKGKVTDVDKEFNRYTMGGTTRKASDVRYSEGHGFDECGKDEEYCHDSRIRFKVNRRRCPNLQTWDGRKCTDEDECDNGFAACRLYETCTNTPGSYKCSCPRGFNPDNYCQDINECVEIGCHKDAFCRNTEGSFSCSCKKGYEGDGYKKCLDSDECKIVANKRDCEKHNNAMCRNTHGSFRCECKPGYLGPAENCEDLDECTSNKHKCSPHARCINAVGSYKCTCKKGYHGDGRECKDIEECKESVNREKCRHEYGECVDIPGGYKCGCKKGYYGDGIKSCKLANECKQGLHNCHKTWATCINTRKSYECRCKNGFEGDGRSCKDINECVQGKHNCSKIDGFLCKNTNGSFKCVCKTGFTGNGKKCANTNECTTGTYKCAKYAKCIDNIGSYSCQCKEGYKGDGRKECLASSECIRRHPDCDLPRAACEENDKGQLNCLCLAGYTGLGRIPGGCIDIDECQREKCSKDANCTNTPGSYLCRCKAGYEGDGFICSDVNECQNEAVCAINAKCTNTKGSFRCMCHIGYHGNAYKACQDVDECKLLNCGYGQNCTNTPGSYVCSCMEGFLPDVKPGRCKDIDECETITKPCGTYHYLSCENEPGTYTCRCKMGYAFNIKERECQDTNECKKKRACAKNAKCTNDEGSYSCICATGYSGDGFNFCDAENSSAARKDIKAWNLVLAALIAPVLLLC